MTLARPNKAEQLAVRTYQPEDQPAVERLYTDGLLAGQIDPNDTGVDIENIPEAFFDDEANHFWVAEVDGRVVGMIGVVRDTDQPMGEIRRLRVDRSWQHTSIGATLIETALAHCRRHGLLKVVLDTRFERDAAVGLFDRFGFKHNRSKSIHGKELLEFYLDLYRRDEHEHQQD